MGLKLFLFISAVTFIPAGNMAFADNGTEWGVWDDFTVWGTTGNFSDADVEIKGFSVFGDTWPFMPSAVKTGTGSVVIGGALEVGGTSYFMNNVGISTGAPNALLNVKDIFVVTSSGRVGIGVTSPTGLFQVGGGSFTVLGNGRVGVGTTNPGSTLDVRGAVTFDPSDVGVNSHYFTSADGNSIYYMYDGAGTIMNALRASGNSYITGGNVGIGTASPAGKLSVQGTGTNYGLFVSTDASGGVGNLVVSNSGNVGIGITGPDTQLSVYIPARTTAYNPADIGTWGDILVRNPVTTTANVAAGIAFMNLALPGPATPNAGTGIAAVKSDSSDIGAHLVFITRGQSEPASEKMRITNNGNVGIGTTNPSTPLEVSSARVYDPAAITPSGTNPHFQIHYNSDTLGGPGITFSRTGVDDFWGIQGDLSGPTRLFRIIGTAGGVTSTRFVIDANSGNVGIGTTSPMVALDVNGSVFINGSSSTLSFLGKYGFVTTVPNYASPFIYAAARFPETGGGTFPFSNYGETIFQGTLRNGYNGGFSFVTGQGDVGNTITPTIKLRIDESGNVGIGTTGPGDHFQVNDTGTATKRFGVQSGNNNLYAYGSYQTSWSDRRLKKNIQPQKGMLERIATVSPVTYYWKPEAGLDRKMHYGVIAQELQEVFPTLVYEDQDGHLNVQRDEMQFILIQSVKELKVENDALKARIEALESKLNVNK